MFFWLKRLGLVFFCLILCLAAITYYQGWQYLGAYTGGGFARKLPTFTNKEKNQVCAAAPIKVVSYNVMYGSALIESFASRFLHGKTGKNELPWSTRKAEIRQRIASYTPDLVGLQEMGEDSDVAEIMALDDYSIVGYHTKTFQYDDSVLLYKTARFQALDSGQFWLGKTPDLPLSLGYRPLAVLRYVNWVLLQDKNSGFTFLYVNTHFDNASVNKEPSASLFRERIASLSHFMPIIVTGDFNTRGDTERYRRLTGLDTTPVLLENAYQLAHAPVVEASVHPDQRIDHILVGGPCLAEAKAWLIDERPLQNGQMASDHGLVFSEIQFFKKP
ncbi:MAG: endonuclease/exonuclease/phosphatase family protein [Methylococcaceae bacterium]|jgi:endonuclease/exonuclease/phosphatase family metal-dependent hydrolase